MSKETLKSTLKLALSTAHVCLQPYTTSLHWCYTAVHVACMLGLYRHLRMQFVTDTGLPTPLYVQLKRP